jgi:hypothetical protein
MKRVKQMVLRHFWPIAAALVFIALAILLYKIIQIAPSVPGFGY